MKKFLQICDNVQIWQIGKEYLLPSLDFVIKTNYNHHSCFINNEDYNVKLNEIFEFESRFFNDSIFFNITNQQELIGTLRIIKYNPANPFPIPEFVKGEILYQQANEIWHVGRFAMNNNLPILKKNVLLTTILLLTLEHICSHKNNILYAECDLKLVDTLIKMGLKVKRIGEPEFIMGSYTTLIIAGYEELISFYTKKLNLLGK